MKVRILSCAEQEFGEAVDLYNSQRQVRDDGILVIAVMHLRREPTRWQDRLKAAGA